MPERMKERRWKELKKRKKKGEEEEEKKNRNKRETDRNKAKYTNMHSRDLVVLILIDFLSAGDLLSK